MIGRNKIEEGRKYHSNKWEGEMEEVKTILKQKIWDLRKLKSNTYFNVLEVHRRIISNSRGGRQQLAYKIRN